MIISRISEVNNFISAEHPNGWVIRERYNDGKAVGFELGCYLKEDTFISVPVHFSLKNKFIPLNSYGNDEYKYYAIPADLELAVSTYVNKKGKKCPILVAPNKERGVNPTFIACIAKDVMYPEVITSVKVDEGSEVIRKFVDKDRSVIAVIAFKSDTGVINPSVNIHLNSGVIDSHILHTLDYTFEAIAPSTVSDTIETEYPVKTMFINLPTFLDNKEDSEEVREDNNRRRYNTRNDGSNGGYHKRNNGDYRQRDGERRNNNRRSNRNFNDRKFQNKRG